MKLLYNIIWDIKLSLREKIHGIELAKEKHSHFVNKIELFTIKKNIIIENTKQKKKKEYQ